jgi:hypothetical protein
MGRYVLGEPVGLTAEFRDANGVLTNPGAVTFLVKRPDGTEDTYTSASTPAVSNPSAGSFALALTYAELPAVGVYRYRAEGTSPASGVSEGDFAVRTIYTP